MTLDVPSVKWAVITATTGPKKCSWQPTLNQGPVRMWRRPRHGVGVTAKSPTFLLGPGEQVPECVQVDGQVCAHDPVTHRGPNQAGAGPALPPPLCALGAWEPPQASVSPLRKRRLEALL